MPLPDPSCQGGVCADVVRFNVLVDGEIKLPNFQRDWAWSRNKLVGEDGLLTNLINFLIRNKPDAPPDNFNNQSSTFFLGSIVTDDDSEIVDGQQRISALTLISCALRDVLLDNGDYKTAHDVEYGLIKKFSSDKLPIILFQPLNIPQDEIYSSSIQLNYIQHHGTKIPIVSEATIESIGEADDANYKLNFIPMQLPWTLSVGDRLFWGSHEFKSKMSWEKRKTNPTLSSIDVESCGDEAPDVGGCFPISIGSNREQMLKKLFSTNLQQSKDFLESTIQYESYILLKSRIANLLFDVKFHLLVNTNGKITMQANNTGASKWGFEQHHEYRLLEKTIQQGDEIEIHWKERVEEEEPVAEEEPVVEEEPVAEEEEEPVAEEEEEVVPIDKSHTFKLDFMPRSFGQLPIYLSITNPTAEKIVIHEPAYFTIKRREFDVDVTHLHDPEKAKNSLLLLLKQVSFTRTKFQDKSRALNHFTLTNDAAKMSSLENYDLFLALTEEIIQDISTKGESGAQCADNIREEWKKIQRMVYFNFKEYGNESALGHAGEFFGRYLLSKGHFKNGGSRIPWSLGKTDVYTRLASILKSEEYYSALSGYVGDKSLEFYKELRVYAEYHENARDPIKQKDVWPYSVLSLGYIHVLNQKSPDILIPLMMSLQDKLSEVDQAVADPILEKLLKGLCYCYARYWVLPEIWDIEKSLQKRLSGGDIYGLYQGSEGWSKKISNLEAEDLDNLGKLYESFVEDLVNVDDNKLSSAKWYRKGFATSDPAIRDHPVQGGNEKFLLYLFELIRYKSIPANIKDLVLVRTVPENEERDVHIEHIHPKAANLDDWPSWNQDEHDKYLEHIGNKCILEHEINRHIWNHKWPRRKAQWSNCDAECVLHYPNSRYDTVKEISAKMNWTPDRVKEKNKEIMNKIVKHFSEFQE